MIAINIMPPPIPVIAVSVDVAKAKTTSRISFNNLLVVALDHDLLRIFFISLVAFNILESVLFAFDESWVTVVRVFRGPGPR